MTRPIEALTRGAEQILGRPATDDEISLLFKYLDLIVKWQRVHRLVSSTDPRWMVDNILLDSLLFLRLLPVNAREIMDLGSGAGLPGIPLSIVKREARMTLVESRARRASFLSNAVRELGLSNARVRAGRVEDCVSQGAGPYDAVVMRCAGPLDRVLPLAEQLISKDGVVLIAGPPTPRKGVAVEWVAVPGVRPGHSRLFGVRHA